MKKIIILVLALITVNVSFSQRNPDNIYLSSFIYTPKDGMRDKFESEAGKKTQMFNNKEGNYIITYRILNGPDEGSYMRLLIFQNASNYNNLLQDGEGDYWEENVAPYVKSASGMQTWQLLTGLSVGEDGPPPKFIERSIRVSKPGMRGHIYKNLYRTGKTLEKLYDGDYLRRSFRLVSGGNPNTIATFVGFDSYPYWGNGESFDDTYNDLFGWRQVTDDRDNANSATIDWGMNIISMERVDKMLPNDIQSQID